MRVKVDLGPRSYTIHIGIGTLGGLGKAAAAAVPGRQALLVADAGVADSHAPLAASALHAAGFDTHLVVVPAGEQSKSLDGAARLYDACLDCGLDRQALIVALGGGVVGDLAGFVAATYMRGVALIQVPTTVLAQIDAAIGGKVAVDHPRGKNLIGAFHQPRLVWCDVCTLQTLPGPELVAGLAEAVKHGVLADPRYYGFLRRQHAAILARDEAALLRVVSGSCRIKAATVSADEQEQTGARMALNLGHTLAHAIERVAGYGAVRHGEAVAIGLCCAGELALRRGLWSGAWQKQLVATLEALGLPARIPGLDAGELLVSMRVDKKVAHGQLRWVLPVRPGQITIAGDVPEAEVLAVLRGLGAA